MNIFNDELLVIKGLPRIRFCDGCCDYIKSRLIYISQFSWVLTNQVQIRAINNMTLLTVSDRQNKIKLLHVYSSLLLALDIIGTVAEN